MIRRATQADMDSVLRMGERFYRSSHYTSMADFCRESARKLVQMVIDAGVLMIAEQDGQDVGMVGLVVAPFMFNNDKIGAYEVFWWVEPEARGGMAAWRLLKSIEQVCAEMGVTLIQMVVLSDSPERAAKMYERAGYVHSETSFTKILRN
jgi:GNAT superfamily N-acetyltransferase